MTRHGWGTALALRLGGAVLLGLAAFAAIHLVADARHQDPTTMPLAYLLALLAFVGASAGAALLGYGRHLFDPVRVAERWARQAPASDEGAAVERGAV